MGLRRRPVTSLRDLGVQGLRHFVRQQAISVASQAALLGGADESNVCLKAARAYIPLLREHIFSQVVAGDVEDVAMAVLGGVEDALADKRKELMLLRERDSKMVVVDFQQFTREVNVVIRFAELICVENLRRLEVDNIPSVLRVDLLVNLARMTGLHHLNLGYGCMDPQQMENLAVEAFSKMHHLVHFSLKKTCSDEIILVLSKSCRHSLQLLDVEGSRDVTDGSIAHLSNFRLRELNIFNTNISVTGLAALLQTARGLLVLTRGVRICQALDYQAIVNEATWVDQKQLRLQVFQACERQHFHTDHEMALLYTACPDIRKMIFKFQPECFSSYLQLAVFDKLQHFETWGGEYTGSGLGQLLEVVGPGLLSLHLCHVEEVSHLALIHMLSSCPALKELKLENCSYLVDTANPYTEEQLEQLNAEMPHLMELRALRVVNKMPLQMLLMVLRKALNIVTLEIDSLEDLTDLNFFHLVQTNRMRRLQQLAVMRSKNLSLQIIHSLLESCPHFQRVRGLENWMSVTWAEIEGFWKFLKEDNVDMDAGEAEWRREQEKERERQEAAMKKMKNLPNDVRSKLGARFQEGQGLREDMDKHLLANPFPEEGEGYRPV